MHSHLRASKQPTMGDKLLSYVMAGVTAIIGFLNWIALRNLLMNVVVRSSISRWAWAAIYEFSFVVFGIVWLCLVLVSQHYYAKGARKHKLWKTVSYVTGFQILLLFLCQTTMLLIGASKWDMANILTAVIQLLVGTSLVGYSRRSKRKAERKV